MSDNDEFADQAENELAPTQPKEQSTLKPLYRQFTPKLMALLLTIMIAVGLTYLLFYQNNVQNNALVTNQLIPLKQQLKHIEALQKADELVGNLLIAANAENFVELHTELISINRQLLQQSSANGRIFQQWLYENKLTEDIVSRIQDSHTRNQQLKQSSIIQLQLMLLSIQPIIDNQLANQKTRHTQLQTDQLRVRVTYSSANAYAKSVQQLNDLQQLKALLVDVYSSFEQLNMHTPLINFEHLRLKVEQLFVLHKQVRTDEAIEAMVDVNKQFDAFEKIVLTEQSALAKWQGYIRLAQDYKLDLTTQQQKIRQLLLTPYQYTQVSGKGIINDFLGKYNIELSDKNIVTILVAAISFLLLFFFCLLWLLREQIKTSAQQGVETQQIMNQLQTIAKPQHSECEFQQLSAQYQANQQLLAQQKQDLAQLIQCNEQLHLDTKEQLTEQLSDELHRYLSLEKSIFPIIQQHQLTCFNQDILSKKLSENEGDSVSTQLTLLRQQLAQFHLALEMKSDKSVLALSDINWIDEIHAILFNKQQEQQRYDNQLFISCDERLLSETKIDFRLFQQLISLFIDITLTHCRASQLHLQVQLQDINAGQQIVHFSAKVNTKSFDVLPDLITQLIDSQSSLFTVSPLIDVFTVLFAKQHGKNIVAQLVDDGYQLSFELPLAITTAANHIDKVTLESTNLILLSSNMILAELVEKVVLSAKGKFERLARLDSFKQQFSAKHLSRHKLDVLVVASDIVISHLDFIIEKINNLPHSLQPKLMVLQSKTLSYERFGFYSQAEHIFCKETFLQNIIKLLANNKQNNQILPCESFVINQYRNQYRASQLPLLLGVQSPQQHQNLQRLLQWLGLQVQVVSHEAAQQTLWKTGQYSLLITEFVETALLEMASSPLVNIGVFSLTDVIVNTDNSVYFENWHIGKLAKESTLTELIDALSPWLKQKSYTGGVSGVNEVIEVSGVQRNNGALALKSECLEQADYSDRSNGSDYFVITEVAEVYTENVNEAAFDFSKYLHNQGTVELALFMIDDYTQDNHQQLDALIEAIKAKNIEEAKLSISALTLNAKILSAQTLELLCIKWSKLLSGTETHSSLETVNTLLKETRIVLNDIDAYAETI